MINPIKSTIKTMNIATREIANIGLRSVGSRLRYALMAFPKPYPVSPVMISAMIVVFKDKAKLEARPTMIYGAAIGTLIMNKGFKPPLVSTFNASVISLGTLLMPPTIDSYNIGKEIKKTMYIGAYLDPLNAKNKKTKAAVGKLLKTVINGLKNKYTLLNEPARRPKIIATSKLERKPINVLKSVHPIDE